MSPDRWRLDRRRGCLLRGTTSPRPGTTRGSRPTFKAPDQSALQRTALCPRARPDIDTRGGAPDHHSHHPKQDTRDSPVASLNAQGKRVMGIRVDDQSQCRQSQDDMMATAPTAVSPPSLSRQQRGLERQLIPVLHESDQTVGGATVLQDTLSGSRYQQCPGCSKHILKRMLMHHVAAECTVCMTQKSGESSDEDPVDQHTTALLANDRDRSVSRGDNRPYDRGLP